MKPNILLDNDNLFNLLGLVDVSRLGAALTYMRYTKNSKPDDSFSIDKNLSLTLPWR